MVKYLYLLLDAFTLIYPLLSSFEPRMHFVSKWSALFLGIGWMALLFIPWDVLFTMSGVWGFNSTFLTGIQFLHLPLEEWLFFIVVPYACMFIYEAVIYFIPSQPLLKISKPLSILLGIGLCVLGCLFYDRWYTSLTFVTAGIGLLLHTLWIRQTYMGHFYLAFLFWLIPFFLVNGILTGSYLPQPIVWYNDAENLGIRLTIIPVEDSIYLLLMMLIITTVYENKLNRFLKPKEDSPAIPVAD